MKEEKERNRLRNSIIIFVSEEESRQSFYLILYLYECTGNFLFTVNRFHQHLKRRDTLNQPNLIKCLISQ